MSASGLGGEPARTLMIEELKKYKVRFTAANGSTHTHSEHDKESDAKSMAQLVMGLSVWVETWERTEINIIKDFK